MQKKISIITINYNDINGLQKTFDSVFNQTYQDYEYIVIDGGSTDGSKELIEQYHDKIDYWVSEPDKGIYNAMNKGIVKATGEFLQFLNSGDYLVDAFVLDKVNPFCNDCDMVFGNCRMIMPDGSVKLDKASEKNLGFTYFFHDIINHQSTFINKNLFNKYGLYDETLKLAADWKFFFIAFGLNLSNIKKIDVDIVYYDGNGASFVSKENFHLETRNVLDEYVPKTIQIEYRAAQIDVIRLNHINKYKFTRSIYRAVQIILVRLSIFFTSKNL